MFPVTHQPKSANAGGMASHTEMTAYKRSVTRMRLPSMFVSAYKCRVAVSSPMLWTCSCVPAVNERVCRLCGSGEKGQADSVTQRPVSSNRGRLSAKAASHRSTEVGQPSGS